MGTGARLFIVPVRFFAKTDQLAKPLALLQGTEQL